MSRFNNHVEVMPVNELELMVSAGRAARQKKVIQKNINGHRVYK